MSSLGVAGKLSDETKQLDWKIYNFFSLTSTKGSFFTSPSFTVGNIPFHLCIYPGGAMNVEADFLSFFLENETGVRCHFTCTLGFRKTDGTLDPSKTGTADVAFNSVGCYDFHKRSVLQHRESEYLPSGVLTLHCTLKINHDRKSEIIKADLNDEQSLETFHHNRFIDLNVLSDNFGDLFSKEDSCDVVLQVKDKEFKAHRTILMARSSVFAAMFQHDTEEKKTGIIKIPDCDPKSFQHFLKYLYCGKIEFISYGDAIHLYTTSDKYDVNELKMFCTEYLMNSLTTDNVCEIAVLADKYDEANLLSATHDFFNESFGKVFLTTEWKNFMKNDFPLANKFLIEMSKSKGSS